MRGLSINNRFLPITMNPTRPPSDDTQARRAGVRRTVLIVAAIALAIYVGFILSGVFAW